MFRVRLGKTTTGNNLVRNGDFSEDFGSLNGWDSWASSFTFPAGSSLGLSADTFGGQTCVSRIGGAGVSIEAILSQPGILQRGKDYRIGFEILDISDRGSAVVNNSVLIRIGDYSGYKKFNTVGVHTTDRKCLDRGDLNIHFTFADTYLTNVTAYKLTWNEPLTNEPVNILDAKFTVEESDNYQFQTTEVSDDLEFVGDGYEYLKNLRDSEGIEGVTPILIEESADGVNWTKYLEGQIAISTCIFNEHEKTVKAEIEDKSIEAQISRNLSTAYNLKPAIDNNEVYPARNRLNQDYPYCFYDELDKAFTSTFTNLTSMRIEEMLRFFIDRMTLSGALVYSNIFGDFDRFGGLMLGFVADFEAAYEDTDSWEFSLSELLDILNLAFNITIIPVVVDGVPIIRIEHKGDLSDETEVLSFSDVKITRREYLPDLPKAFIAGYRETPENTYIKPYYYDSGKVYAEDSVKELLVPTVKVVGTGMFQDADITAGDWVLYESQIDSLEVNNEPALPYNYTRPYYKSLIPKSPNNANLIDFTFIAAQWKPTLPFSYQSGTNNQINVLTKTNSQYLEEIEFETYITDEDWQTLIAKDTLKQLVVDPIFNSQNYWTVSGNFSLQNGRAVISSYASSDLYSTLREPLTLSEDYHIQLRLGDKVTLTDCEITVRIYTAGKASGGLIETITSTNGIDDLYDIFFTNPLANAEIIEIAIDSTGASPEVNLFVLEVNLWTTNYQRNLQKCISVNGKTCKIRSVIREQQTGKSEIKAYLKS